MSKTKNTNPVTMEQILTAPTCRVEETAGQGGVLAALFRTILRDNGITPMRWQQLISSDSIARKFAAKKQKEQGISSRHLSTGNIGRELAQPNISWKVFTKGLGLLQIKRFKLNVQITHSDGKETIHTVAVSLNNAEQRDSFKPPLSPNENENINSQTEVKI